MCVCVCVCVCVYTWEEPKIRGIFKKIYVKCFYKFETLVPFEILPLRLYATIPAPLPILETLSKIFNGNAVKGRQRIANNFFNNTVNFGVASRTCLKPWHSWWRDKRVGGRSQALALLRPPFYVGDQAWLNTKSPSVLKLFSFRCIVSCFLCKTVCVS